MTLALLPLRVFQGATFVYAGIDKLIGEILSVEEVGVFKPDKRVYQLAVRQFGCAPDRMVFVSSNAWDAQAALHAGFRTVRVNRRRI